MVWSKFWWVRSDSGGSRILVRGRPSRVLIPRDGTEPKMCSKSLKIAWKLHDFEKKSWGQGPTWIRNGLDTWEQFSSFLCHSWGICTTQNTHSFSSLQFLFSYFEAWPGFQTRVGISSSIRKWTSQQITSISASNPIGKFLSGSQAAGWNLYGKIAWHPFQNLDNVHEHGSGKKPHW